MASTMYFEPSDSSFYLFYLVSAVLHPVEIVAILVETITTEEIEGAVARAIHPVWLIDNHIEWKLVHQAKIPGKLDVAFNAREALFYLVNAVLHPVEIVAILVETITTEEKEGRVCRIECSGMIVVAGFFRVTYLITPSFSIK